MAEIKPKVVNRTNHLVPYRQHIDYQFSATALRMGNDLFFTGLRRQTVHAAAKKLGKMIGDEVVALPYVDQETRARGYILSTKSALEKQKARIGA